MRQRILGEEALPGRSLLQIAWLSWFWALGQQSARARASSPNGIFLKPRLQPALHDFARISLAVLSSTSCRYTQTRTLHLSSVPVSGLPPLTTHHATMADQSECNPARSCLQALTLRKQSAPVSFSTSKSALSPPVALPLSLWVPPVLARAALTGTDHSQYNDSKRPVDPAVP